MLKGCIAEGTSAGAMARNASVAICIGDPRRVAGSPELLTVRRTLTDRNEGRSRPPEGHYTEGPCFRV